MKIRTLFAVAALALPLAAHAEFEYTYLEGGYFRAEPDAISDSGDGIGLRGSAAIADNLFISGEFNSVDIDLGPFGSDIDTFGAAIGVHMPLTNRIDVVGSAGWVKVDAGDFIEDDGARLDLGLRGRINPAFELDGGVRWVNVGDDETTGYLRGLFGRNALRLLVEVEAGDEGERYIIGGRYDFR